MKNKHFAKTTALLLAIGLCSGTVLAEETDVVSNGQKVSLLNEFLGTTALEEAIQETGLESMLSVSMQEGMADTLGLGGMYRLLEKVEVNLGLTWNPAEQYWNIHADGEMYENTLLAADLYGDAEKLLLGCEPFYDGVIGIRDGSVKEQYAGSGLEDLVVNWMGGPSASEVPDLNLEFYPEASDSSDEQSMADKLQAKFAKKMDKICSNMIVSEESSGNKNIYHAEVNTSDVLELVQTAYIQFFALGLDSGLMEYYDAEDGIEELMDFVEEAGEVFGDTIRIDAVIEDGNLTGAKLSLDMTYEDYTYDEEGEAVWETYEAEVSCELDIQTTETDTSSVTMGTLLLKAYDETVFEIDPFVLQFDSASGNLDATAVMIGQYGDMVTVTLDSDFTDVISGEQFVWNFDELSLSAEGEKAGLCGSLSVSAGVRNFSVPENAVMICEESRGELFAAISEIAINNQKWIQEMEKLIWTY